MAKTSTSFLEGIFRSPAVDVPDVKAATVAKQVSTELAVQNKAVVPVKSPFKSKINWTGFLGLVFTVGAMFGLDVPPEVREAIMASITTLTVVMIWIFKTFFTNSVSSTSL